MKSSTKEEVGMCECGWCGSSGHSMRGHFTHRLIVIIIATVVAFWVGFKLGEIQGFLESMTAGMFSHHNWSTWEDRPMQYNMMQGISAAGTPASPTAATTAPATTTPVRQ